MARAHQPAAPPAAPLTPEERAMRTLRRVGIGILIAAALIDGIEESILRSRIQYDGFRRRMLRQVDSRAGRIATVGVALLDATAPRERHQGEQPKAGTR